VTEDSIDQCPQHLQGAAASGGAAAPAITDAPGSYPLLGHLPPFLADKLGFLRRAAAAGGEVVRLRLGGPTLLLLSARDIRHVLVGHAERYEKSSKLVGRAGQRLYGTGLMTLPGDAHLERRRMLQPVFRRQVIDQFAGVAVSAATELATGWEDGSEVDVDEAMAGAAERIMIEVLLGLEAKEQAAALGDAVRIRRRYIEQAFVSLLPAFMRRALPSSRAYYRARRRLDRVLYDRIAEERRRAGDPEMRTQTDSGRPDCLLSLLAAARDENGDPLTDSEIHDEAAILSVAGYETTGEWLAWTFHLLACHPDVDARLAAELDRTLGGRTPAADDVASLPYTSMVLAESLRLYPPSWIFLRVALEDDALPSGAVVARGTKLYLCPWVVHRLARYFPEPERFDPERFAAEARGTRPQQAYFPFGAGPRLCIGEALARMEAVLVTATIAARWRFEAVDVGDVVPVPGVTLRPRGGLRLRLQRR
jgi:cytochrome P450